MICKKCNKKAIEEVEYAGFHYCDNHFLELMEKRIRKHLRTAKLIDVKKHYILDDDSSSEAELTAYFLNKIFKGRLAIKIQQASHLEDNENNIIYPTNLDEQAIKFLNFFLYDEKEKVGIRQIMPLEVLTEQEIRILCRILNIKFKKRIEENILDSLEEKYPGTKFSVFQSRMNLISKLN
jgi:hypothetical protein